MRAWSAWWILIIFVILEIQKSTPAKLEKFSDDKMDLDKISKREKVNGVLESTDTDKVNKRQDEKENVQSEENKEDKKEMHEESEEKKLGKMNSGEENKEGSNLEKKHTEEVENEKTVYDQLGN